MSDEVTTVYDLAALGIDSAEARWLAARDYLVELETPFIKAENAIWLVTEFLDLVETNAVARGAEDRGNGWGLRLHAVDYLTARSALLGRYKGAARTRAREVLDQYVPPELRKETANVRR